LIVMRESAHRRRSGRGQILLAVVAIGVLAFSGYCGYVAVTGSDRLVAAYVSRDCTTPADPAYGWAYEAINYDPADDLRVIAENPDTTDCEHPGIDAGEAVVTADGTRLAGWHIPAASPDPARPTVLVVHGHDANKSVVLPIAAALHDRYDLVLVDLRATGQSSGTQQTLGAKEQLDVAAILTWLETEKGTERVAALGVSGGAAAVLADARTDDRIDAVIADSVHARFQTLAEQYLENEGHPAYPGAWAAMLGIWIRTGADLGAVDPIDSLAYLGDRPLLLIHGTEDTEDVPSESVTLNYAKAQELGLNVEMRSCEGGKHAGLATACPDEYRSWVAEFLDEAFGSAGG
jgi:pimeloyl-ACP methyl ester carboxylesterase